MDPERERRHKAEYRRAAPGGGRHAVRDRRPSQADQLGARGARRRAQRRLRGQVAGGRLHQLPLCLHRPPGEQGVERHRLGVRAQQDPRHREGPAHRRAAGAQGPSDRHQAALPRYRLLRDLQPRQRPPGRRAQRPDRARSPRPGCARRRAGVRARCHRARHRLRRDDRRAARDRHPRPATAPTLRRALGGRAAHLSRPDGGGLPQHVRRHRPGQPRRARPR